MTRHNTPRTDRADQVRDVSSREQPAPPRGKRPATSPRASSQTRTTRRPARGTTPLIAVDDIRLRAYFISLERGDSDPVQDWLEAERQLAVQSPPLLGRRTERARAEA